MFTLFSDVPAFSVSSNDKAQVTVPSSSDVADCPSFSKHDSQSSDGNLFVHYVCNSGKRTYNKKKKVVGKIKVF